MAVTVNCVDDPPHAVNDQKTVAEDSAATAIDVRANDTDPDGGPKTISSATQPAHGTVTVAADGSNLSYRPNPDYCNSAAPTDDFTYTLNGGSTATVAVTVNCVDDPPHAVNDQKTVAEDSGTTTIDVRANDTDPDGGPKTISSATQPAHGTVTVAADGSNLSYRPNPDYCNSAGTTDDFTYTLNGGSTATVAVTVNCVDDPPTRSTTKRPSTRTPRRRDRRPRQRHRPRRRPEDDQLGHPARPRHGHGRARWLQSLLPAQPRLLQHRRPHRRLHLHP